MKNEDIKLDEILTQVMSRMKMNQKSKTNNMFGFWLIFQYDT